MLCTERSKVCAQLHWGALFLVLLPDVQHDNTNVNEGGIASEAEEVRGKQLQQAIGGRAGKNGREFTERTRSW